MVSKNQRPVCARVKSILEYTELNYAAITSSQNAITDTSNQIQTEIDNIELPTNLNAGKIARHHETNHEQ